MLVILESLIPILFVVIAITGVVALILRRKIRKNLLNSNKGIFKEYFGNSSIFDGNMKSSSKIAKFFIFPSMWKGIVSEKLIEMLSVNRKVEITYYCSLACAFVLFVLVLLLKATN